MKCRSRRMLERKQKMPPTFKVTAARRALLTLLHWSLTYEMNLGRGMKIYVYQNIPGRAVSGQPYSWRSNAAMSPCIDKNLMAAALLSRRDALLEKSCTGLEVFQLKIISSRGWNTAACPWVSSYTPKRACDSFNKKTSASTSGMGLILKGYSLFTSKLDLSTDRESKNAALPGSVIQTASSSTVE